ncbi:ATP-binding cassette domain-containing protein [Francisella adeliensis]|uniref:ATP-binding cassette domain-containing protein n=1 Tax=Francisella adeliensis TaxID=2007306 RepID=UPI001F1930B0|nr:ATP-binding cassette domain-containing protein [Francisella adeliensis]
MSRLTELRYEISKHHDLISNKKEHKLVSPDNLLEVNEFSLADCSESHFLLNKVSFSLKSYDRLLINGASGIGKSTLLRAIARVGCNSHQGDIVFAKECLRICLFPQKPYYPEDDFKRAVFYPIQVGIPSDEKFVGILRQLGVEYLAKYINTRNDWRNFLSSGEQQKLNFCRVFIKKYDLLLLDEATSNIDVNSERRLYEFLQQNNLTYISASHNERIKEYHNRFLDFSN